ncbi:MAG: hypothetical protein ACI87E_001392 [Mariniblastus sp.]|jgi:hypothetical protein
MIFSDLSRLNYWSYSGYPFNQRRLDEKQFSLLFQLSHALGSEIQSSSMKMYLQEDFVEERNLPLIYVNTMLIGESRIEYRGLMRSETGKLQPICLFVIRLHKQEALKRL